MKFMKRLTDNRGMTTFIALMMMIMLTMIGVAAIKMANDEVTISGNEMNEMQAFYAAEAGLERAASAIQTSYMTTNAPPATLPTGSEALGGVVAAYSTTANGALVQKTLSQGTLAGLNASVRTFTITSSATSSIDNSQIILSQEFEAAMVPIFQFAVFYGNDLEIAPGPDMTLIGRVHSNGNLWLQSGSNLYMESFVTCSGQFLHGRKGPGGTSYGNVYIKDADGNYANMKNSDGSFLQATDANWYDTAASRWDGRVQDSAFGQGTLDLPLTNVGDPHKLIERASGNPDSYENKADLRIIDGVVEARVGASWVNVTALLPAGTVTSTNFTDQHEGKVVNSTDIDIAKLSTSAYFPSNGVVYVSDHRSGFNGARLKNGANIGQSLSLFSENPVYVQGDFNSVNKKPAAICGDAVTFLSNNWNDANSASGLWTRNATETTVNAAIMTGNNETTASNYNGGLENLPRFLEGWSGVDFNLTGSLVNLWNSQQATGPWSYGSYYTAPNRKWSYDTDFDDPANLPPETPVVRVFQRIGWRQQNVGYVLNAPDSI